MELNHYCGSHSLSQTLRLAQQSGGQPGIWNTLVLWSSLAPSDPSPQLQRVKWGRDSLSKANKFSLCLVYTKLCEPFRATWEEIRWLGTLLASENYITKNVYLSLSLSFCVFGGGGVVGISKCSPFPSNCTRWTPSSGTPVGQNSIITTLFPKEMMCFLTWATRDWTLGLRTGNWKNKHTHPAMQYTFNKCLQVNIARKMCQNHNNYCDTHAARVTKLFFIWHKSGI